MPPIRARCPRSSGSAILPLAPASPWPSSFSAASGALLPVSCSGVRSAGLYRHVTCRELSLHPQRQELTLRLAALPRWRESVMAPTLAPSRTFVMRFGVAFLLLAGGDTVGIGGGQAANPYKITISDGKEIISQDFGPVDPTQRITFQHGPSLNLLVSDPQAGTLQRVHFPMFHIDGNPVRVLSIKGKGVGGVGTMPLPKSPSGKERIGFITTAAMGDLHISMTTELVPGSSRGPGQKRQ